MKNEKSILIFMLIEELQCIFIVFVNVCQYADKRYVSRDLNILSRFPPFLQEGLFEI